MYEENDLIGSDLQQSFSQYGRTVEIYIYRMPDTEWTLEIVDEYDNSTVWDETFATDQLALDAALKAFEEESIYGFVGLGPDDVIH
jgi:hypothetical protein